VYAFLESRLWFDELYNFYVQKIQQRMALLLSFLDVSVLKGLCMRGSAGLVALVSLLLRMLHTGNLHNYVAWFLAGVLLLSAFVFACA
jgi:NADH-quinone oxidoreductase subunit L